MANEFCKKVLELTYKALKYKPINKRQAIGRVVERFHTLCFGWSSVGKVITFTDGTALYYDHTNALYPETHICITGSFGDGSKVTSYLTEFGQALCDENLLNDIEELLQAEKQRRIAYNEENKQKEINKLKEKLKQLEND